MTKKVHQFLKHRDEFNGLVTFAKMYKNNNIQLVENKPAHHCC